MPPALAIPAAVGLAGTAVSAIGQHKAGKRQEKAAGEALAFQREQAARAEQAYRQREMQRLAMRNALLQRYGLEVPGLEQFQPGAQGPPGGGGAPGGLPGGGAPVDAGPGAVPRGAGLTLQELAMRGRGGGY